MGSPGVPYYTFCDGSENGVRFGTSKAVQYQATCFMNRGLDECPSAAEDRDRDRYRMSLETAPFVVRMVKGIGSLQLHDYKDSLTCEMVKETLKLLDNLVASAVTSRLDESQRLECTTILVKLVTSFHTLMGASEHNAGLPGASGKLSPVELKPAVRALVMFVSPTDVTDAKLRCSSRLPNTWSRWAQSCREMIPNWWRA
jgi:hypothetical protein